MLAPNFSSTHSGLYTVSIYFSPKSGEITTTDISLLLSEFIYCLAAYITVPDDPPKNNPYSRSNKLHITTVSSSGTIITSKTLSVDAISGFLLVPIPGMYLGDGGNPKVTDPLLSTAIILVWGEYCLKNLAQPTNVPVVPAPIKR